ncbi:hypothetical protein [Halomonas sp. M20]|uniref:hypothetical protein n=1 Tax=Halomonas sp. M20 TaxID=2763264 RepID=UPI001D0B4176|nr:hypothetical protein [Halomonas sp. M20]
MKFNKPRQMDEREKLRKFRELDDAFAQALKDMDGSSRRQQSVREQEAKREFEQRLRTLMSDFHQTDTSVDTLLRTLIELGKIA